MCIERVKRMVGKVVIGWTLHNKVLAIYEVIHFLYLRLFTDRTSIVFYDYFSSLIYIPLYNHFHAKTTHYLNLVLIRIHVDMEEVIGGFISWSDLRRAKFFSTHLPIYRFLLPMEGHCVLEVAMVR